MYIHVDTHTYMHTHVKIIKNLFLKNNCGLTKQIGEEIMVVWQEPGHSAVLTAGSSLQAVEHTDWLG